ncbi:MAG TPA: MFS transporter [Solirubrobacteraceae bacterium]|nr:MFS transporter [Solirubrobacteraceae bacterium]
MRLHSLKPDLSPLRASRDLRLVVLGGFLSGLGSQATLVALPYQVYVQTHSALLVGLLGSVELVPLVAASLLGGAVADRVDRRMLLLLDQVGLVLTAAALALAAWLGHPPLAVVYALAGLLAAFTALQNVATSAIVPGLVVPAQLRSALALNYGLSTLTMVVGPALGGILIAALGLPWAYAVDALSCAAMVLAMIALTPQPPVRVGRHEPLRTSIADGLRYVRGNQALLGSFAIDLVAMIFGMPRALFAVLSVSVYHTGAAGAGALYSAVAAGATVSALTTGWLRHVSRLGRVVVFAVTAWGVAIALAGLAGSLWIAAVLFALAGAADSVSAVCRTTINQSVTPEHMRGRMSAVYSLVVSGGPRLGDIESGVVAGATGPRFAVVSGGVLCVLGVGAVVAAFPALLRYDATDWIAESSASRSSVASPATASASTSSSGPN